MRGAGRGWGDFLWKIPGGGSPGWVGAEGGRGREVVCGECLQGGGGLNIFFRGRNVKIVFLEPQNWSRLKSTVCKLGAL